jgi:hypothetical protein
MLKTSIIFVTTAIMTLSACTSLSIGTKVGDIRIDTVPEQPKVIVNGDSKKNK